MKRLTDAEVEFLNRNVAALIGAGVSHNDIRTKLSLNTYELRKALEDPNTQRYIAEMGEETSKAAIKELRRGVEGMAALTLKALKRNLEKDNIAAVKLALEVLGVLEKDSAPTADSQITVILPGASLEQPQVFEVQSTRVGSSQEEDPT